MTSNQDYEKGYSPGGGYEDTDLLRVSPEQRLIMRSIPFFVLPPHETTPRTSHIGPKVDTHNTSYVPAQPRNVGKPYAQKLDYSQVKSRIDTGRSTSPTPSESTSKSFGHLNRTRLRTNAHHSSSPSPGLSSHNFKLRVSAGHSSSLSSKSERLSSPRSADYSHIKSRINAGSRPSSFSSAKSEKLSLSADSGLRSRISGTVAATEKPKMSSSPLPDYSHIKSRTDSGQRPRSKSPETPRLSSMSHNKAGPAEDTRRSSQAVKFGSPRLSRAELPRSRVPISDTFPTKARKSSPAGAVNRYRGVTGLTFGSPEKHHQKSGNSQGSINNSITRQLEPEFGRVSSARSFPQDTQDKIPTRVGPVNYRAKAKSRIDCCDPNPSAHKLKHSLNELIVPLGRDINPRFTSSAKASKVVKSSSFHVEKPVNKTESESSLVKSSTFESLFEIGSSVPDLESEIKKATQASTNPAESASSTPLESSPAMEVGLETIHHHHKFGWTESEYAENGGHDAMFSEAYSTQGKKHEATVNSPVHNGNHRLAGKSVTPTYEDSNTDTFGVYSDTSPSYSRHDEGDLQVVDFEVTNSETETTVVLKHLLALSSLSKEKETTDEATYSTSHNSSTNNHVRRSTGSSSLWTMPAIEESDSEESESYYESEEIVKTPSVPIVPYTLPIPTINLQDEDGTILETILKGTKGLNSEEDGTDATVNSGSDSVVVNYSPQTVYDDELGPSTKL